MKRELETREMDGQSVNDNSLFVGGVLHGSVPVCHPDCPADQ